MHRFERVTEWHIKELAEKMRPEEVDEVYASNGDTPEEAVRRSVARSVDVFATMEDDRLMSITGCAPYSWISDRGSPWLLTTVNMKKSPRHLLRHTQVFLGKWRREYGTLINFVDARYEQSLRWAKWAGFTIHPAEPFGFLGLPFHKIEIKRED